MTETTGRIRFDVTQEHRTGGNGATYVVKNYKKAIEHPAFQQAIKMGDALGYRGHPRRKMLINGEITYEPVLFPHEDEAVPTHVCVYAAMDGKYCIHEQKFLTGHEEGRIVKSLWDNDAGGFSSRASTIGGYGGRFFPTKLARMAGMDFVRDRSYRYNSKMGVIATESAMHELSIEYLMDELGVNDKAAHFICNGGMCPNPKDIASEQATFWQIMENELALEEVHKKEIHEAYRKGVEENLDNERAEFNSQVQQFQEEFKENQENELNSAIQIAIECLHRMPRKPHLPDEFFESIAPALIKNGTEQAAIESVFYKLINPFTGYTLADFIEPEQEFVYTEIDQEQRVPVSFDPEDSFLKPR